MVRTLVKRKGNLGGDFMLKLYGKNPRCLWCGEADKENYKEIIMTLKYARLPQEKAIVCSQTCEKAVLDTCRFIERSIPVFLVLTIIGTILGVSGIFTAIFGKEALRISIIGVMVLGVTFIIFPFVTPQTVKLCGLKKGMILGRIGGVILYLIGVVLVFSRIGG